jgi:hypothetical protein
MQGFRQTTGDCTVLAGFKVINLTSAEYSDSPIPLGTHNVISQQHESQMGQDSDRVNKRRLWNPCS